VITVEGRRFEIALALYGAHQALNAAAALAGAWALGADLEKAARALESVAAVGGRGRWQTAGGVRLLDETYNANPASVRAALDTLLTHGGKRFACLADMKELGDQGAGLHQEIGAYAARAGLDGLFAFGDLARQIAQAARANGLGEVGEGREVAQAVDWLMERIGPGSAVLVKGSRSMRTERILQELQRRLQIMPGAKNG